MRPARATALRTGRARRIAAAVFALAAAAPASGQAATGAGSITPTPTPTSVPNAPGVYHVWSCRTASGAPAPTDGWGVASDSQGTTGIVRACDAGGGLAVLANGNGPQRSSIEWKPVAGLRAASVKLWRSARATTNTTYLDGGGATAAFDVYRVDYTTYQGQQYLQQQSYASESAAAFTTYDGSLGDPNGPLVATNVATFDPIPQTNYQSLAAPLYAVATCFGQPLATTCTANYTIWRADFRMIDPAAPTGTADGAVVRAVGDPTTPVSGRLDLSVDATDPGSGVLAARVEVDGTVVATASPALAPATCTPTTAADGRPSYVLQQPCPLASRLTTSLDTTSLSDGQHAVRVLLEDAAGNTSVVTSGAILVRNAGTIGPGSPLELRGGPNGSPATDAGVLTVAWPSTARQASTKASVVKRCKAASYAAKHPVQCKGRAAATTLTRGWAASPLPGAVRLTDGAGAPISGAVVQLAQTPQASGAAAESLGSVTTGADGTATFSVDLGAGSRTVEGRWSARANDTRPAATGTATVVVAASTSLHAPARAGRGARVRFSGQLDGRAGALARVPISLQVRSGGAWKTFATASTDGVGSWSTRLRFAKTPGSYAVRAKVGTSTTYPYAAGGSRGTVTVRVH